MINIQSELLFLLRESEEYYRRIQMVMEQLPSENIYSHKKGNWRYYYDTGKKTSGKRTFLGRADNPEVQKRLKYQVCKILFERVQKTIDALNCAIEAVPASFDLNDLEEELPEKYKEFPRSLYQELKMIDFQSLKVQKHNLYQGYKESLRYKTMTGVMVRSKSEQIIADRLYMKGIQFEYESLLTPEEGPEIHPDFRLFYPAENRWIYLEHIGRLDDPRYVESFKRKVCKYIDQGMLIGSDIYFTYDRPDGILDLHILDIVISMILQEEDAA